METHGPLCVLCFVEPAFCLNTYLLWTTNGPDAWIIDPGLPPQAEKVSAAVRRRELSPRSILLTHCHADHIAGVGELCSAFPQLQVCAPRGEEHMLTDPQANLSAPFGFCVAVPPAHKTLVPGDRLTLGTLEWQVLDVSGHSLAGLAFYCPAVKVVFTGDALFAGNIGRYDFPGSSGTRLLHNIRRNLLTLPPETVAYSGHGPATTIGVERETNPCVQDDFIP